MDPRDSATAHQAWDERWSTADGRAAWLEPEDEVVAVVNSLPGGRNARALDLGCGVGRHALCLAQHGLRVSAIDASSHGIDFVRREAARRGLPLSLVVGAMTDLPYRTAAFGYVLSWNVIYHGTGDVVRRCISEIHRVLRPGGVYQGTMLSKRHERFGRGRQVAPNTFVQDSDDGDRRHPHFYCDSVEAVELFAGFELRSLAERMERPDKCHWHVVATRCSP